MYLVEAGFVSSVEKTLETKNDFEPDNQKLKKLLKRSKRLR
jgi:hypothetical protein